MTGCLSLHEALEELVMTMNHVIWTGALALALAFPVVAQSEPLGTSCADCPSYSGAFSIENKSRVSIYYQYRWGNKHPWKSTSLGSGRVNTHSYPLGSDKNAKAPSPFVKFDRIGGDTVYTGKVYDMDFHAVGYSGYGAKKNTTKPKRYYFEYAADRKHLKLYTE
jgi:hypothetical protein